MAIAPRYQQRAPGRASEVAPRLPADFGQTNIGQTLSQTASLVADAMGRIGERNDAVARARTRNDFDKFAVESLNATMTTSNISDTEVLENYYATLRDKKNELLAEHTGSPNSYARLEASLAEKFGGYQQQAITASLQAGRQEQLHTLGTALNDRKEAIRANPAAIVENFDLWSKEVGDASSSLDPGLTRQFLQQGMSEILEESINSVLATGGADEAAALLESVPNLREMVSFEALSRARNNIAKSRYDADKGRREGEQAIATFTAIAGRAPTAEERLRIAGAAAGIADAGSNEARKIAGIEEVLGRPLTEPERLRAVGLGPSGGTAADTRGTVLTANAPTIIDGSATPDEVQQYLTQVLEHVKPHRDPFTQEVTYPNLPAAARHALSSTGIDVTRFLNDPSYQQQVSERVGFGPGQQPAPAGPGVGAPAAPAPEALGALEYDVSAGRPEAAPGALGAAPEAAPEAAASPADDVLVAELSAPGVENLGEVLALPDDQQDATLQTIIEESMASEQLTPFNLWNSASALVTPLSTLRRLMRRVPWVADIVAGEEGLPGAVYAASRAEAIERRLARVLQGSPRFAQMEYHQILESVNLGPQTFQSVGGYRERLSSQVDELFSMVENARAELAAGDISDEKRKNLMDRKSGAFAIIRLLGAPITVTTQEQLDSMPPNVWFRIQGDHNEYIIDDVPGEAQ